MSRLDGWLTAWTQYAAARPWRVLLAVFVVLAGTWTYAAQLSLKGDFVELLPTDSQAAQRFQRALERRAGAGSTLVVLAQGANAQSNQRFVTELQAHLAAHLPDSATIQVGPGEAREFYIKHRWLFADLADLERLECELERERGRRSPGWLGLDEPCEETASDGKQSSEGADAIGRLVERLQSEVERLDRFPTGFFRTESGDTYALLVRSSSAGMGEWSSDHLYRQVRSQALGLASASFPQVDVHFAGDIPNAIAEREALIEDVTLVLGVAIVLILLAMAAYFRGPSALLHIGLSVAVGCGVAFSVAMAAFGHLNAATSFLGSIIAGNGINHAIIYIGRYRERRERGDPVSVALCDAAVTCRKSTWLAALAAGGAYAALMLTSFRGFNEFGLIGATGMLACWVATFAVCPASLSLYDRRRAPERRAQVARHGRIATRIGALATQRRWAILLLFVGVGGVAAYPLPAYFADPWEYDFGKLRSRSSATSGAALASKQADRVFGQRGSPQLVFADDMEHALEVERALRARDQKLTGGQLIKNITTVFDRVGGTPDVVEQKLEVLARIREHLDAVRSHLSDRERKLVQDWRPPEWLRPLIVQDLPSLLRSQFVEKNGRVGTAIYVTLNPEISLSRGENLLQIAELFEGLEGRDGQPLPTASRAVVFAEMIRSMERDGPRATLAAFLVVVIATAFVTRSLVSAVLIVSTLLVGILFTVGAAAWAGVKLNFLNFVALPLTFGIGVEYAINLYERIRRLGGNIVAGSASAGGPVFLCSLTTIIGYGSLLNADNRALQSFGAYAIVGEFACILSGLILLPALLRLFARRTATEAS